MKRITIAFIALLCMAFMVSCEEDTVDPDGLELPGNFILQTDSPLISVDDDFDLSINEIADSRCPSSVTCVWEGVAQVSFSFTHDGTTTDFDLHTNSSQDDAFLVSSIVNGYYFEIIDVTPYPEDDPNDINQEDYMVEVRIEER